MSERLPRLSARTRPSARRRSEALALVRRRSEDLALSARAALPDAITLPNAVTLTRLVLTAPLNRRILQGRTGWGVGWGVALWSATDWVDGVLARTLHQESAVGRALDPIADRIGIASFMWSLSKAGVLPRYLPAGTVAVDLAALWIAGPAARRGDLRVTYLGKVRSTVSFCAVVAGAFSESAAGPAHGLRGIARILGDTGLALHALAGLGYIRAARKSRAS